MPSFLDYMVNELASAGLSDEQVTAALTKMASNEKLGPKLNALVKTATEDYNAQVGRVKQYQDWYPKAQAEYDRMAAEVARVTAELESAKAGGAPEGFDPSKYVSRADLAAFNADLGTRYAGVIKDTNTITAQHVTRFKEIPDFAAIDKIATEQNIPLPMAYEKWVEPRVKEADKAANEQWKKDQREEIERDLRSRYQLPTEQVATETAPMYRKGEEAPKNIDAELIDAWRSTPAKT
jgi:hypothetical protein